jgi:uncharacterized protein YjiS (DUF1127 family)
MVQRTESPIFLLMIPALPENEWTRRTEQMFASLARLFEAWKRHGAVRRELAHLSDRELADIGITRSDIERIASGEAHS